LTEFINKFKSETKSDFDYEEFYDWFNENYDNQNLIEELSECANLRIKKDHDFENNSTHYIKSPDINQYNLIYDCFNYLIGDLLGRAYQKETTKEQYRKIIESFNEYDNVNIFTLNHDLLMEYLLKEFNVKYSSGFSTKNSFLTGDDNIKIEIFDSETYTEKIKLFKTHGSIDNYIFEELVNNKGISTRTGKYWYFKPKSYHHKHFAKKIDLETGKTIQQYNWNIIPQFLTGKNKKELLADNNYYQFVFEKVKESFKECDKLIIIGYSYGDSHINEIIEECVELYDFEIVNINPSKTFPFENENLTELKYINEF
jgi:hypothetical protein